MRFWALADARWLWSPFRPTFFGAHDAQLCVGFSRHCCKRIITRRCNKLARAKMRSHSVRYPLGQPPHHRSIQKIREYLQSFAEFFLITMRHGSTVLRMTIISLTGPICIFICKNRATANNFCRFTVTRACPFQNNTIGTSVGLICTLRVGIRTLTERTFLSAFTTVG